ncbi:MAG TPA: hypothetical protein VMF31_02135 [Solirubrobacterales bacterium]|nr:hypothetical protein [Solirubrobacterales bacterium]
MPLAILRKTNAPALAVTLVLIATVGWVSLTSQAGARTLTPPSGQTYLGVTDTGEASQFRDFARAVGKHPPVIQTFHPWGNSLHQAMPRWKSVRARPMLHITTRADDGTELITPRQIALGRGDDYLLRLNTALDRKRIRAYIRPMGEPNRCLNAYAGVDCSGNVRGGSYAFKWYKSAFRRIAIIVRGGGKRGSINADLKDIGLPKIQKLRKKGKLPRRLPTAPVALIWSPLPGGSPTVPTNRPSKYWPGKDWVDWVATDFYSRYGSWRDLKRYYAKFAIGKNKPFALTEWGLWGSDKPGYVKKIFRFMRTREQAKMLVYYQDFGTSNEFRIQNFPKSRKIVKRNVMKSSFPKFAKKYPR